jgi:hypothetical protein
MAVLAKERIRMPEKPIPTIAALAKRAEALQHDINAALDDLVACDRESCPNLPEPVIKGLRTARHLHGFCACRWAQDEAKENHERQHVLG